jgi:Pyruvate phosphate dikinase, AMP/ATP-binding domain
MCLNKVKTRRGVSLRKINLYMELNKDFFSSNNQIAFLGDGELGGKAQGLEFINSVLSKEINQDDFSGFEINIPKMIVIRTDIFDLFMRMNDLYEIALSDAADDRIALAFQKADLPFDILADLRMIVTEIKLPLAIRSSSLLEDAKNEPFAGIYGTKMTPNNQLDLDTRFRKLVEAVKYVYASTFFKAPKQYIKATNHKTENEKMAIIIQEVVGQKHDERFYPEVSGVARSYNFYPTGGAKPEQGVVNLALGLGKTIVDGGVSWAYCPKFPQKDPPFKSVGDMMKFTQLNFWSVNLGKPSDYDPIKEAEYLFEHHITEAEEDGTIKNIVSTYDAQNDRIWPGKGGDGPRIVTFAPILHSSEIQVNNIVKKLLEVSEKALNTPVEIEFAVTLSGEDEDKPYRFGFLQVRPMVVSAEVVEISDEELEAENAVIVSENVLGNGELDSLTDIIFVKPESFKSEHTHKIAKEIDLINKKFVEQNKKYILIGFGRWGTTDAWAGIPVDWSQISAAKVIIESGLENMMQEMSQASHFFHNVTSFQVLYFSIPFLRRENINWDWLKSLKVVEETELISHVKTSKPVIIKANGKEGKGVITI